jgi:hypothetical protein
MSKLAPSWLPAPGCVAVHDVNSRYLFLYNSDYQVPMALFKKNFSRTSLTSASDQNHRPTRADAALVESMPAIFQIDTMRWWKTFATL